MSKVIWTGLEDSGKSLEVARMASHIMYRNAKWAKKSKELRPIVYNMPFSDKFLNECARLGVPTRKWKDLEELVHLKGCDLFVDEIGTYFDSRTFANLPLDIRLWLAQASKLGVDMFGAAQDFAQVDVSFRRLTTHLYLVTKLAGSMRPHPTRPPVKRIWGVYTVREMDPRTYDTGTNAEENAKGWPWPHFIYKEHCELYDTTQRIEKSAPPPFKHVARHCEINGCNLKMYHTHNGQVHKISHV